MTNNNNAERTIINNSEASRFEMKLDDEKIAKIDYVLGGKVYMMTHTEVPPEYGGQGIAGKLARFALDAVRAEGFRVVPLCPYIRKYITEHSEYSDLVAQP